MITQDGKVVATPLTGMGVRISDILVQENGLTSYPLMGPTDGMVLATGGGNLNTAPHVNFLPIMLGTFILLVVLKFASEHEKSEMQPHIAGIGLWNFFVIGIMSVLFINLGKVVSNLHKIPYVSEFFNAA